MPGVMGTLLQAWVLVMTGCMLTVKIAAELLSVMMIHAAMHGWSHAHAAAYITVSVADRRTQRMQPLRALKIYTYNISEEAAAHQTEF